MKLIDLTGKRFGKWLVLGEDRSKTQMGGKYKRLFWKVRCDCGTERLLDGNNLRNGVTKQCYDCGHVVNNAGFNDLVRKYKASAKERDLEFALSEDMMRKLFTGSCAYCGCEPYNEHKVKECRHSFTANGIDRKDSGLGYTEDNCVSCCRVCNIMKMAMSIADFLNHISKIEMQQVPEYGLGGC